MMLQKKNIIKIIIGIGIGIIIILGIILIFFKKPKVIPTYCTPSCSQSENCINGKCVSKSCSPHCSPNQKCIDKKCVTPPPLPPLNVPYVNIDNNPSNYYSIDSTNGSYGLNMEGDLIDGTKTISLGLKTVDDLNKYPLTFAIGHPYWKQKSIGDLSYYNSWDQYINNYKSQQLLSNILGQQKLTEQDTLVIEGPTDGSYSPVIIDIPEINITGLVVRKMGICLFGPSCKLRTQFVLVESGGLLQAGSSFSETTKYNNNLDIVLINPSDGFTSMGEVASQYSWKVYAPGASKGADKSLTAPYTGDPMAYCNVFGAKVIAGGFNGSIHLSGNMGDSTKYKYTWYSDINDESKLPITVSDKSNDFNVETKYVNTWVRMNNDIYKKDTNFVIIDPEDRNNDFTNWIGSQVVLTNRTSQYTSIYDTQGLSPLWLDNDDPAEANLNDNENTNFINKWIGTPTLNDKNSGVEVQKVLSYDKNSGKLTFKSNLKFNHDSTWTTITRSSSLYNKNTTITTSLHIGLLSRKIRIYSELSGSSSLGCNRTTIDKTSSNWKGPGGKIVCNTDGKDKSGEVYDICYNLDNLPNRNLKYCNNKEPDKVTKGHWIFGTGTKNIGCNSILGGHQMYHNGSSSLLDGVELKYMGQPANFGSIARYAIHWHLAGYTKTFKGYLPTGAKEMGYNRSSEFINCSNWCSFSRWVTIHGAHETNVKNNVCFISFGSGIFVEDGTETMNTIEHNLCVSTLISTYDSYYNTIPIYPNVSTDACMSSTIWLKNNQNRVLRNVICNSPAPIIAIWMVPQTINTLRGPSTVCLGDEVLGLPSIASIGNGLNYLSQNKNNFQDLKNSDKNIKRNTVCWVPDDFPQMLYDTKTKCLNWGSDNSKIPYQLCSENVFYQIFGGISEFPEAISGTPTSGSVANYFGNTGFTGCPSNGIRDNNKNKIVFTPKASYMPDNGQNSCTDTRKIAPSNYFATQWGAGMDDYPYKPINIDTLNKYNNTGLTYSRSTQGNIVPKYICNTLTYNLGSSTGLWGGAVWVKNSPAFFLNCCFLESSWRLSNPKLGITEMNFTYGSTQPPYASSNSSLAVTTAISDGWQRIAAVFGCFHNIITNGGFAPPSFPTIISGKATFFSDTVIFTSIEYNNSCGAINNYYLSQTIPISELISPNIIKNCSKNIKTLLFINMDTKEIHSLNSNRSPPSLIKETDMYSPSLNQRIPYMCDTNNMLFKADDNSIDQTNKAIAKANPQWNNIVINSQVGVFISPQGIALGNLICTNLSKIPKCPSIYPGTCDNKCSQPCDKIRPCCGPTGNC